MTLFVQSRSHLLKLILRSVDPSAALDMPGVVDYITAKDIPNLNPTANIIGPVFHDEELFATKEVHHVGQMIGIIVAESEEIAREATRLVKVQYEKRAPIVTIEVLWHVFVRHITISTKYL